MGITIEKKKAQQVVKEAHFAALSYADSPNEWTELARTLREDKAPRTYTAALGASLLARACTEEADPLSIKEKYSDRSFSLRTLCHTVLVPASVELGFDIGATGREPINNQPFFRYDHYDEVERIKSSARPYFKRLRDALASTEMYSERESFHALVAVLSVCIEAAQKKQRAVAGSSIVESSLIRHTQNFVTSGPDIPRKLQACAAAGLDMAYDHVASRRINDPSRDIPGDVHVFSNDSPTLAVEVRGKAVTASELEQFVRNVAAANIPRAALLVENNLHTKLPLDDLAIDLENRFDCLVKINESISSFLRDVFVWSTQDTVHILGTFPQRMFVRMSEIEVRQSEIDRWADYFPSDE